MLLEMLIMYRGAPSPSKLTSNGTKKQTKQNNHNCTYLGLPPVTHQCGRTADRPLKTLVYSVTPVLKVLHFTTLRLLESETDRYCLLVDGMFSRTVGSWDHQPAAQDMYSTSILYQPTTGHYSLHTPLSPPLLLFFLSLSGPTGNATQREHGEGKTKKKEEKYTRSMSLHNFVVPQGK